MQFQYAIHIAFSTQKPPYRRSFLHELFLVGVEYLRKVLGIITLCWWLYLGSNPRTLMNLRDDLYASYGIVLQSYFKG